jgi:hypothetical protein
MKPITIYRKWIKKTSTGQECTPYSIDVDFFGNLYFKKNSKSFPKKFFSFNGTVLHILGFRFVKSVNCHHFDSFFKKPKNKEFIISRNDWACNLLYKFYSWLLFGPIKECLREKGYQHNIYDNLGPIDTLGYSYHESRFTYTFSEELGGYRGIKLPFGWCLEFDNEYEPYIVLKKFHSLLQY